MNGPNVAVLSRKASAEISIETLRRYWQTQIHDIAMTDKEIGSKEFFRDLQRYHFEKLSYLPEILNFPAYGGRSVLEIGCGVGIDLVRFAEHGAIVTAVDLASRSIELAKRNFANHGLRADLRVMNGEELEFPENSFDMVYAHGVLQYTLNPPQMVREIRRVLRPEGEAIVIVYNKYSWLNLMAHLMGVRLEHEDAPVFRKYSIREFRSLFGGFSHVEIIPERFPVKTKLHHGVKATLYNEIFVGLFNRIPRPLVKPFGWHLVAKAVK